tara:strand:- start:2486 stop:3076 length:591 start_codon:yes stop_codon:yes gene_type:complete
MTLHVTKLNNAINIGDRIPMTQEHGNIGRYIEYSIKRKGYALNRGKGIDLKGLHLEIKTRLADSTSGHTVGAMLPTDIVETEWENSNIHDKVQKQYRVEYKDDSPVGEWNTCSIVTEAKVYDFTHPFIQEKLKKDYNFCRAQIVDNGFEPQYISGDWAYLEMQPNGYYQFRITPAAMKKMKTYSKQGKQNNLFFEE